MVKNLSNTYKWPHLSLRLFYMNLSNLHYVICTIVVVCYFKIIFFKCCSEVNLLSLKLYKYGKYMLLNSYLIGFFQDAAYGACSTISQAFDVGYTDQHGKVGANGEIPPQLCIIDFIIMFLTFERFYFVGTQYLGAVDFEFILSKQKENE